MALTSHLHPEGDSVGSALALGLALQSLGKEPFVVFHHGIPRRFSYLPGQELVRLPSSPPDLMVLLDVSQRERADLPERLKEATCPFLIVDHHPPSGEATVLSKMAWIEPQAAATGEMVYHLIRSLKANITSQIAACLYAALGADTGFFRYTNTNPRVLRLAATLLEKGVDPWIAAYHGAEERSLQSVRLLSRMLSRVRSHDGLSWSYCEPRDFHITQTTDEDTEEFVNFLRAIEGTKVAVLFRNVEGRKVRISFRANGQVDVAAIARRFGGGGHPAAAGCRMELSLKKAIPLVLSAVSEALEGLKQQ